MNSGVFETYGNQFGNQVVDDEGPVNDTTAA